MTMKTLSLGVTFACLVGGVLGCAVAAGEWARFRGPNGTGLSDAVLPVKWTESDYAWKATLPGVGHSSPVVWGERIFVTAGNEAEGLRIVVCLSAADGKQLWQRTFDAPGYRKHKRNSIATATPAVDAQRLYISWGTPEKCVLVALDHDGKTAWEADLGPFKAQHGFGSSPIVHEGAVVIALDQDGKGEIVALDTASGKVRWRLPRRSGNATYSTPCVFQPRGRPAELIFTNWQHGVTAVDPGTGKVNWEISVFEPQLNERAIASPVVAGDLILATCGFVTAQKHFVAIRPYDAARGMKPTEVWRVEKQVSYLPTPLVKGDRVFLCSELGIATCLEPSTGKVIWQERVDGNFSASPVGAGDRMYCVANNGDVFVLAASDRFELLGRTALGEPTQSTPALANGRIYFRTPSALIALGGKQ
jgi:outer membrane protein assembly factor BamB